VFPMETVCSTYLFLLFPSDVPTLLAMGFGVAVISLSLLGVFRDFPDVVCRRREGKRKV
jgi:hypothetical protein